MKGLAGIFVGGASRRMGGSPKGLLLAPGTAEPLVVVLARRTREAALDPVLVGDAVPYAGVLADLTRLADEPAGVGPLGGLRALLRHALARDAPAIAVACDMPHVTSELLRRLATHAAVAPILAPRGTDGTWEPLLARYDPVRVLPELDRALADGTRSFQALFARLEVAPFELADDERIAVDDWDTPDDVT